MTEHLPECHLWLEPMLSAQDWCICDRLRKARDRGYSEACDDGWGEPEHIKEAISAAVQRVMELPDLLDAGFTYSGLLHREVVIDAIRRES